MTEETMNTCPICERQATGIRPDDEGRGCEIVECQRCGTYEISGTAFSIGLDQFGEAFRRAAAVRRLTVNASKLLSLDTQYLKNLTDGVLPAETALDGVNRIIQYVIDNLERPTRGVRLEPDLDFPTIVVRDPEEFQEFRDIAQRDLHYLKQTSTNEYTLTIKGWEYALELPKKSAVPEHAFVAMWFDSSLDEAWTDGFGLAIEVCGLRAMRIDKKEHNEKICDRILAEIKASDLVVADFTGHRPGVYYEAGYAQGLAIPVVWTCREDQFNDVHFDTRQYNHIIWKDIDDLRVQLRNRIRATLPVK